MRSFHEADEGSREALLPNQVSLINLASIHAFERVARQPVDPRRFRGNFLIEDLPAWEEFGWIDREIRIDAARLRVVRRIQRCAATNVNPETAERSEEHTSELQSLMRLSYAVSCL